MLEKLNSIKLFFDEKYIKDFINNLNNNEDEILKYLDKLRSELITIKKKNLNNKQEPSNKKQLINSQFPNVLSVEEGYIWKREGSYS